MGVTFAWRSETSSGLAFHADGDNYFIARRYGITGTGGTGFLTAPSSNIIGNTYMLHTDISASRSIISFPGGANTPIINKQISALVRYVPDFTGAPAVNHTPLVLSTSYPIGTKGPSFILANRSSSGDFDFWVYDPHGDNKTTSRVMAASSMTAGEPYDLFFTVDWTGGTNATYSFYYNSVLQTSASIAWNHTYDDFSNIDFINLGAFLIYSGGRGGYNEVVVWDTIEDPTSINTVTPGGVTTTGDSLDGAARDGWVDVARKNGLDWTSITAAQIKSGVNQVQAGLTQSGSYLWTSITAAQIGLGVEQIQAGLTQTGSLATEIWSTLPAAEIKGGSNQIQNAVTVTGSYLWSSLTAANIAQGVNQIQDSVTVTGSLTVPIAVGGTAGVINLPTIKENIRWILDTHNTTTSSVLDLSSNMQNRVKQIAKVNPENIPIQASKYPAVTVHVERKTIEPKTIAKNQVDGKRKAVVTFRVSGLVWNDNFQNDIYNDPADQDLEILMENAERILRSYHDLGSNVTWQVPSDVTYHNASFDEDTHFRVAFLDIEATIYY